MTKGLARASVRTMRRDTLLFGISLAWAALLVLLLLGVVVC
jgi:hypothetical protein